MLKVYDGLYVRRRRVCALLLLMMLAAPAVLRAQDAGSVTGSVTDAQGLALPGVQVVLRTGAGDRAGRAITDWNGWFTIAGVEAGVYVLTAELPGFETREEGVTVGAGGAEVPVALAIAAFTQTLTVTAMAPEMATELVIPGTVVEQRVAQDLALSLREHPGVTALRRGAVNLDPSVRGLYAEQIGVFVDGTRTFAAGPARMDSELSHVSPHALQALRVVRGPYALTWGAGTLSAIQAETFKPAFGSGGFEIGGRAGYNYGSNGGANDAFAGLHGSSDRVRFSFLHNTRTGSDYTDGNGDRVAGDYESFDTRWNLGARLSGGTLIEYSGGHQQQNDIDYPGRILDATFFRTRSHAVDVSHAPARGAVKEIVAQVYVNLKDHLMNNDHKPTARAMPGRIPPFGLRVDLPASSDTSGGRVHVAFGRGDLRGKVGADVYRLAQSASRTIARRADDRVLFRDTVWPDVRITNAGGYGQVIYDRGVATLAGTLRVDHERAGAGEGSSFFQAHAAGDPSQDNTSVSAAGNLSLRAGNGMVVNLGAGRAVRNPSVLERYSDRFPAVKFQTAAEFLGDPGLVPEKSLEFNAGVIAWAGPVVAELDVFHRTIDDYITVMPDASLPKRLPLSPPVVFRYVQGDQARFIGFDLRTETTFGRWFDLHNSWSYVRAEDTRFGEPLFGIPGKRLRSGLRFHTPDRAHWVEMVLVREDDQDRVAAQRFEVPTAEWTTLDLDGAVALRDGFTLRAGVQNLTDRFYVNHLNSFNPFTGQRIAEVGRSAYIGAELGF